MSNQPPQRSYGPGVPASWTPPPPAKKRGPLVWILGGVAVVLVLCVGVTVLGGLLSDSNETATPAAGAAESAPASKPAAKKTTTAAAAPAKETIKGDDLVHIGEDAPAGTYRAAEAVDGNCYWMKSKDAEGADIIDNGIPAGGRPQVTLKDGQWFTSQGCPDWIKK